MANPYIVLIQAILWYALTGREEATMLIMYTMTYPLKSTLDAAKRFIEALKDPPPDYINELGPYVRYGGKGIKAYWLVEIEKGHEDEGIKEIAKRLTIYFDVEGYEIDSEVVVTAEEAVPLLGLEM
jgi:hypothetical protein